MAQIQVFDSGTDDIFVCGICKVTFHSLQLFLDHKRIPCQDETKHTVDADNSLEPSKSSGISNPSIEQINQCHQCRKKFKRSKALLEHIKTHSSDRPFQCSICGRCFVQNKHLKRHILSHQMWPNGLSETTAKTFDVDLLSYCCSYCETVLSNYSQFRAHLKHHTSFKQFKCIQSKCVCFFETVECLLEHVSSVHNPPKYTCNVCCNIYNSLDDIASHYVTHIESKHPKKKEAFKCSYCDAVFTKSEKLTLHMLTENHKKTCIHCKKTFLSDKRLRLHLQIHRKQQPYQCYLCNQSFKMKKYLASHMLKHGESQFACNICDKKFKRQDLLQRHMRLHQMRKFLKCPFKETLGCEKQFVRRDNLQSHVRTHTKRITSSTEVQQKTDRPDASVVEIRIVPLDDTTNDTDTMS